MRWTGVWKRCAPSCRHRTSTATTPALLDGVPVSVAELDFSLTDNLDRAWLRVYTAPGQRGNGYARQLLDHLEGLCREAGRTIFNTDITYPMEPEDVRDVHFATRQGYAMALGDVQRVLDLPVAAQLLDNLATQAAPQHTAYSLHAFSGAVPEEVIADYAALTSAVATEAPMGSLGLEPSRAGLQAFRDETAVLAKQGRTRHGAYAVAADGRLAGYTDIVTAEHDPGRSYQWGTLVLREHRGHQLGLTLKVLNVATLQAKRPDITVVRTWNAESNTHMVGVNEQLGYRAVDRLGEFQKSLR